MFSSAVAASHIASSMTGRARGKMCQKYNMLIYMISSVYYVFSVYSVFIVPADTLQLP
jgi:hypothetical protein